MNGTIALDTLKSFKTIFSKEDFEEFIKSEDSAKLRSFDEVQEFLKAETNDGEDSEEVKKKKEEDEKKEEVITKAVGEIADLEKSLTEKKTAVAVLKGEDPPVVEENLPETITSEIFKGFTDLVDEKLKAFGDLAKGLLPSSEKLETIEKSIGEVSEVLTKISGMPVGTKALRNVDFFSKSFGNQEAQDEDGKKILSTTLNKEPVLKALEDGLSKSTDEELKKSYEDSIIKYNGGGGTINQDVAMDLFENHKVRLIK